VSGRAIVVAGLSAIAMAAGGCSGDSDPEAEFRAAFKKRFGEAPWYHHITRMEVGDKTVEIRTDLVPKDDFYETATPTLCHAAFKAADLAELDGIEAVHLIGADGEEGGCA
jgi:hypothetical protein